MKEFPMSTNRFAGGVHTPTSIKKLAEVRKANGNGVDMGVVFDESMAGQSIDFELKNTTKAAKTIALTAGLLDSVEEISIVAGVTVDAIAKNGAIESLHTDDGDVTVECAKLAYFQKYVRQSPVRISEIQMSVNDQKYFRHNLQLVQFDLIKHYGAEPIKPNDYVNEANNNANLIHMFRKDGGEWQLDGGRILLVTLGAGEEVTLSLELGTCVSTAEILAQTAVKLGA